jgi:hypothetical protein
MLRRKFLFIGREYFMIMLERYQKEIKKLKAFIAELEVSL